LEVGEKFGKKIHEEEQEDNNPFATSGRLEHLHRCSICHSG